MMMEGNTTSLRTLTYALNFSQVVRGSLTLRLLFFISGLLGPQAVFTGCGDSSPCRILHSASSHYRTGQHRGRDSCLICAEHGECFCPSKVLVLVALDAYPSGQRQ